MPKVFLDYDQAALDAALNNRAQVPDHQDYFDRWASQSEQARQRIAGHWDMAYGPGLRQKLDYFPARRGGPLLVFIHGGYWQALDHKMFGFLAPRFVDAGINFAAIGYDLCPAVSIATIGRQMRDGVAFLHGQAANLGFDAGRMFVCGHSAGGHLSALLAQTDWTRHGLADNAIKGAMPISGLYDLEPIRLSYLNANVKLDAAMATAESPLAHIPKKAPPLLLICGAAELAEFPRQQRQFAAAWQKAGLGVRQVELAGCNHFSILDGINPQTASPWAEIRTLMGV